MSKTSVIWAVALGVVFALLGLFAVSAHSVRPSAAGPGLFTEAVEPELPPVGNKLSPAGPDRGVTLTH